MFYPNILQSTSSNFSLLWLKKPQISLWTLNFSFKCMNTYTQKHRQKNWAYRITSILWHTTETYGNKDFKFYALILQKKPPQKFSFCYKIYQNFLIFTESHTMISLEHRMCFTCTTILSPMSYWLNILIVLSVTLVNTTSFFGGLDLC